MHVLNISGVFQLFLRFYPFRHLYRLRLPRGFLVSTLLEILQWKNDVEQTAGTHSVSTLLEILQMRLPQ